MDNSYILSKEDKNSIEISNLTEENINLKKQNARNEGFSSESKEKKHVRSWKRDNGKVSEKSGRKVEWYELLQKYILRLCVIKDLIFYY